MTMTTVGSWMLERLGVAGYHEELAGDLLEQLAGARPGWWYWRQVFGAVGLGIWEKTRRLGAPLIFSALWSMAYELYWQRAGGDAALRTWMAWLKGLDVAYSSSFGAAAGIMPLVGCVWSGMLVYVLTQGLPWRNLSRLRLVGGMSISLNAALIGTAVLRRVSEVLVREQGAVGSFHPMVAGLGTGLALFVGLVFVMRPLGGRTAGPLRG